MGGSRLRLGPVSFRDFEVPERVSFGGLQKLATHELFGGGRVIDILGSQPVDVTWSGVFSGADASTRVQLLDDLRVVGTVLPLSWDVFAYLVVIERMEIEYSSPWWIHYRMVCKVVQDSTASLVASGVALVATVAADLATAASYFALDVAQAAVTVPGATTQGTTANIGAIDATVAGQQGIEARMTTVGSTLGTGDLGTTVAASGELAGLGMARGYTGSAAATLATVE